VKIALVLERFDPERGGLEHWTWQYAAHLTRAGHDVHVVAFSLVPELPPGIVTHTAGEIPRSRIARAQKMAEFLATLRFDVIHDMGLGWSADVIHPHGGSTRALWEHNLLRIPKWRQIRFWRERRYREMEELEQRQLSNTSAIIVAVSQMVRRHFEELHGVSRERIRVVYNGVDVARFTPANRALHRDETRSALGVTNEVVFLMLAHNLLLKNANAVIRAAARLRGERRPIRVVIAGGKRPEPFLKLSRRLNLENVVSFLGPVDPIPFYAAADVFVHPTWYDPCSLVTLEASACGLPVITTRFNGASELMEEGEEGFLLDDPADVAGLAGAMRKTMDATLRERLGEAGRALAERHTFEQQTNEFIQLYREAGGRKAASH
jgi:UDP-glucose:(heptosyl)LPS alpha-1,3-glucosyltransferase